MSKIPTTRKRIKKIKGFGVFVRAYGGLIAFSRDFETAVKYSRHEYAQVSMSRSEDEFKVKEVTIRYSVPSKKKPTPTPKKK